uniref:Alpha-galactosidase n=1 Tax=Acrobeloides nanus TaxID=290746 RepID=A0A914DJH9_9BILA
MHQKGLKLGIYEDYGYYTCMGYPGSYGHVETDAQTFADWNVDYLKFDGCNIDTNLMPIGYPEMAQALNKTGKPIVYSCSWPAYLVDQPDKVNYTQIGQSCNVWRNFVPDIRANWSYISDIIDYYTDN